MESTIKHGPQQENFNEADAGDASASIYQNEDTLNQESQHKDDDDFEEDDDAAYEGGGSDGGAAGDGADA